MEVRIAARWKLGYQMDIFKTLSRAKRNRTTPMGDKPNLGR